MPDCGEEIGVAAILCPLRCCRVLLLVNGGGVVRDVAARVVVAGMVSVVGVVAGDVTGDVGGRNSAGKHGYSPRRSGSCQGRGVAAGASGGRAVSGTRICNTSTVHGSFPPFLHFLSFSFLSFFHISLHSSC